MTEEAKIVWHDKWTAPKQGLLGALFMREVILWGKKWKIKNISVENNDGNNDKEFNIAARANS